MQKFQRPWALEDPRALLEVQSFQSVTKVSEEKMNTAALPLEACRPLRCWSPAHPPVHTHTHTQPSLGHLTSLVYSLGKGLISDFYCPASHSLGREALGSFQILKSFWTFVMRSWASLLHRQRNHSPFLEETLPSHLSNPSLLYGSWWSLHSQPLEAMRMPTNVHPSYILSTGNSHQI